MVVRRLMLVIFPALTLAIVIGLAFRAEVGAGEDPTFTLFDFRGDFQVDKIPRWDAKVSLVAVADGNAVRVQTGHRDPTPGITLPAPQGKWDLSRYEYVALELRNVGPDAIAIGCRVDNPGAAGDRNCVHDRVALEPGERSRLTVLLWRRAPEKATEKLFGMRVLPGLMSTPPGGLDASNVTQLIVHLCRGFRDADFEIHNIRAGGSYPPPKWLKDEEGFFPFIDEFGQYMHADWAGKLKSAEEFAERRKAEAADLAAHSGPADWDRFGGWEKGPTLKATGFFRAEKLKGKWWLVDPDGKLFWSHGIDSASAWQGDTPITDRRHYFKWLPDAAAPEGRFYRKDSWAPLGYYKGRQYETYTFFGANLARKYGADWNRAFTDVTHARLRSWGMNTIGNWSHADIYMARKTPYTVPIYFRPRPIAASEGYWRKFPDPFDPTFAADLRGVLAAEKGKSAGDPWCIGYFVDNELSWGDGAALAVATLASPPEQSAKRAFLEALRKKYQEIEKLNAAWGTQHASWEALSQSRTPPERGRARADLDEFATRIAEQYFRTVRDAVKEIAPNNLYLGCRFGWMDYPAPAVAVRAAASFCDVISFNVYQTSVAGFRLPEGLDAPVIIGEFQFGALDRGLFHPGLQPVADQQERAARYRSYIEGALRNAQIVGAHWFEYGDQAATGRGDGENCQFGFVDVTDTPYRETIQACRDVGYRLYTTAWGNK